MSSIAKLLLPQLFYRPETKALVSNAAGVKVLEKNISENNYSSEQVGHIFEISNLN